MSDQFCAKVVYKSYSGGALFVALVPDPGSPTALVQLSTLGPPGIGIFSPWATTLFCSVAQCSSLRLEDQVTITWYRTGTAITSFEIVEKGSVSLEELAKTLRAQAMV